MASLNANQKLLDYVVQIGSRLERIEAEVKEIKGEIGLKAKPSYAKKLGKIQKEKGKTFNDKEKFLSYLKNGI